MGDSEALRYAVAAAMPSAALMGEVDRVIQAVRDELYRQGFEVVRRTTDSEEARRCVTP